MYCALKEVCHYEAVIALVILQCSCSAITHTVSIPTGGRGNEQNHNDYNTVLNERHVKVQLLINTFFIK